VRGVTGVANKIQVVERLPDDRPIRDGDGEAPQAV
jgi:hypothetical protein